jgi:RNase P/RNase MRP subunit POP5
MAGTDNKNREALRKVKTNRQKLLLPTLKEQQRYVVYRIVTAKTLKNFGDVHNNILMQCNGMLGIFDGAKAGLLSAKYNAEKNSGIIRVDSKYVDKLKICLGLIKSVNDQELIVDSVFVSGMMNKAIEKMDA